MHGRVVCQAKRYTMCMWHGICIVSMYLEMQLGCTFFAHFMSATNASKLGSQAI